MLVPTVLLQTPDGGLQEFPGQRVEHHVHTLPSRLLQDVILKGAVFGGWDAVVVDGCGDVVADGNGDIACCRILVIVHQQAVDLGGSSMGIPPDLWVGGDGRRHTGFSCLLMREWPAPSRYWCFWWLGCCGC